MYKTPQKIPWKPVAKPSLYLPAKMLTSAALCFLPIFLLPPLSSSFHHFPVLYWMGERRDITQRKEGRTYTLTDRQSQTNSHYNIATWTLLWRSYPCNISIVLIKSWINNALNKLCHWPLNLCFILKSINKKSLLFQGVMNSKDY